jgi:hypothetical protein
MRLGPFDITRAPGRRRATRAFTIPALQIAAQLLAAIVFITWHEVAYRRFIPASDQSFELGGTVSHAAADMISLLFLLLVTELVVAYITAPRTEKE